MEEKEHNTSDDIIELIDIVQDMEKDKKIPPVVDFDDQLSGLFKNSNKTISLDDAPELDEILGSDKDTTLENEVKIDLDKADSSPEDLDTLLDNLFEEDSNASLEDKEKSTQKEIFLEKALEGIDDIDALIAEAESPTSSKEGMKEETHSFSEVLSEEANNISDLEEIEAILDSAMPIAGQVTSDQDKKQVADTLIQQSLNVPQLEDSKNLQKLEEEVQNLKQQIATLELIIMDHEAEVEDLQEKNCKRLESLEVHVSESLSIEKLTEKVFSHLQKDIDKAAAEAAVRVIHEEIASLKSHS